MMANKTFLLINRRSGKALQATGLDNGLVVEQSEITYSDAQLWSIQAAEGDIVKIANKAASKVLDVMKNGTENGTRAQTWEDVGGESQLWTFALASRGYRKLINVVSGRVLDIQDISDKDGAAAQLWDDVGGSNQEWKVLDYPVKEKAPAAQKTVERIGKKTLERTAENQKSPRKEAVQQVAPKAKASAKAAKKVK